MAERILNLIERGMLVATGVTLVVSMLYVAGNYQDFSSETQNYLLYAMQRLSGGIVVSVLLLVTAELLMALFLRRSHRLRRIAVLLVTGVVIGSILLGATSIIVLQQPV